MFIPKYFEMKDLKEIKQFINDHSFATVVTTDNGKPVATHVPLMLREDNENLYLSGHYARANTQWKNLDDNADVLTIFHGPHAFVSSTWYDHENVSTWNYQSIHVYGHSRLLTEDELREDLKLLLDTYEANGKTWDNLTETSQQQIRGIVGFRIDITDIQAAYKLSQNRNDHDYENIISELSLGAAGDRDVAAAMKKLRD
ncbi:FMN-binding negative transcriptional regulator [Macrococcus equipercicus]|uniref:FMN-binding negative transcriptional regulator n=1 Tax=Macrococcus equipercicus TaxID=69967 RepID=A0A9Q9BNA6_9STAP|nr:FMN-binding negative transcriptional regulator [Macrococcus equipercicus]KAA1036999.1 FMN-binding negative transcriptional regulator [Macrococcus equipercicus]UTH14688.1 FMN-binding negative transcriptional regulator [Macrococcus equipercicus]